MLLSPKLLYYNIYWITEHLIAISSSERSEHVFAAVFKNESCEALSFPRSSIPYALRAVSGEKHNLRITVWGVLEVSDAAPLGVDTTERYWCRLEKVRDPEVRSRETLAESTPVRVEQNHRVLDGFVGQHGRGYEILRVLFAERIPSYQRSRLLELVARVRQEAMEEDLYASSRKLALR